jgi:AraC-like DNA-binding protein
VNLLRLKIANILARRKALHDYFHKGNLLEPDSITLTSLDEQFLKDAVEAVNKHLDDPEFDVEKLSDCIKLSSNQTYRKIKALTGQTAKEFIRSQRLKTAAKLLLQKKRTVSEIIYMVGFSSPSYFTRCFREYFGVTPSEFIEKEGKI